MKGIFLIFLLLFGYVGVNQLSEDQPVNVSLPLDLKDPVSIADQYLNMNEVTHIFELEDLMGVNPMRTAWCASFINAVLDRAGYPTTNSNIARSFVHWGREVVEPRRGDIVVFSRAGGEAWEGHVGFFIEKATLNGRPHYVILGGNQNNNVSYDFYPVDRVVAIRRYIN